MIRQLMLSLAVMTAWTLILCAPAAQSAEDSVPEAAWSVRLPANDGTTHALKDFKGKLIWVDFWASWCSPCRQSFPWLSRLQARLGKKNFTVLAINVDENRNDAIQFIRQFSPNFPIMFDSKGILADQFQVPGMPSSFLIDADGHILMRHTGFRPDEARQLAERIQTLVEKRKLVREVTLR